jgi:uncharacterized protein (TIGR00369 family)
MLATLSKNAMPELSEAHRAHVMTRFFALPAVQALNFRDVVVENGACQATAPRPSDGSGDGIFQSFHGGLLATIADSLACLALLTQLPPDAVVATTDLTIHYLSACLSDATARARVLKTGRTLSLIQVDLFDANARLVATAQVSYIQIPQMPARES